MKILVLLYFCATCGPEGEVGVAYTFSPAQTPVERVLRDCDAIGLSDPEQRQFSCRVVGGDGGR